MIESKLILVIERDRKVFYSAERFQGSQGFLASFCVIHVEVISVLIDASLPTQCNYLQA